ncbi:DUF3618 domain-containing protein [Frigidibacter sp. SD6-1]|uniref:DUF3618 domain-containing protein n=1 Tax=Frigidibacter sp. SD6-1 TaxID=3032581 RepID=UPI0024DF487F|nr:DUF3618 domain-containing protein [Frigidibacter sp. SD6-1]
MTQHSDLNARETELEEDRESLASTLDQLHERMSVDHMAREALGMLRDNAGYYSRSLDRAIRANPMALAMTGVGLAWLIFGGKSDDYREDSDFARFARLDRDGDGLPAGSGARGYGGDAMSDTNSWSDQIGRLRQRATGMLGSLERGSKDYVAQSARVLSDFTADMTAAFRHGLDDLSEAAGERVMQARQAAYAASLRVERGARAGGRQAGQMMSDHPLVAGAVALAMGAALGAALPRTRIEDRNFGAESDRLMAAAADMLREERARMMRVAEGVVDEVKSAAKDAADAVAEGVEELGTNIEDRAEREKKAARMTEGAQEAQKSRAKT